MLNVSTGGRSCTKFFDSDGTEYVDVCNTTNSTADVLGSHLLGQNPAGTIAANAQELCTLSPVQIEEARGFLAQQKEDLVCSRVSETGGYSLRDSGGGGVWWRGSSCAACVCVLACAGD